MYLTHRMFCRTLKSDRPVRFKFLKLLRILKYTVIAMKIFWLDGGLHAEPETAEEGKALQIVYYSAQRSSSVADVPLGPKTSAGASTERSSQPSS